MRKQWVALLSMLGLAISAMPAQSQVLKGSDNQTGVNGKRGQNTADSSNKLQLKQRALKQQNQPGGAGGQNGALTKADANRAALTKGANNNGALTKGAGNNALTKGGNNSLTKGANNSLTKASNAKSLTKASLTKGALTKAKTGPQ
ncbi:MAG TPA: hypothetical protein VKQ89_02140 [Candidatus Angelobacter sp.]|nr:hypothetical protein [Candidatus Angelobacter sp.]